MKKCNLCYLAVIALMMFIFTACDDTSTVNPKSDECDFVDFTFNGIIGKATIKTGSKTIVAKADESVDLAKIKAEFELSDGASAKIGSKSQVSSVTSNDFTEPVVYVVTAEDGKNFKEWTVAITKDDDPGTGTDKDADFVSFTFSGISGSANINKSTATISANASLTTSLSAIVANFSLSTGATAKVGGVEQVSGTTANNFSSPVVYAVTSGDGSNQRNWTVTITQESSQVTELTNEMINKSNATLEAGVYLAKTNLTLTNANILIIKPGVVIKFNKDISFTVNAKAILKANGTETQPILLTSNSTLQPGDWHCFRFVDSPSSELEWCTFEFGSGGSGWSNTGFINLDGGSKVSVKNCTLKEGKYSGIYFYDAKSNFTVFSNNNISNCGETEDNHYPIKAEGGIMNLEGFGDGNVITTAKGIGIKGGTVNNQVLLKNYALPYVIYSSNIAITASSTLTIEAGTTIKFDAERGINVNAGGKLVAVGKEDQKITFTCSNITQKPGNWYGIRMEETTLSEFDHCNFEYGSGGNSWSNIGFLNFYDNGRASVKNCKFSHGRYSGIYFENSTCGFNVFQNNIIENCGENENNHFPIYAKGGIMNLEIFGDGNVITTNKGIGINGGNATSDVFLKNLVPYVVLNNIGVNASAVLTIQAGSELRFALDKSINVNAGGKLSAIGTIDSKINFTSNSVNKLAGDWFGIRIVDSPLSEFEHCVFDYGSGGNGWSNKGFLNFYDSGKASVKNCIFQNAKFSGIYIQDKESGFNIFENNTITNCGETQTGSYPIEANGGIMALQGMMSYENSITTAKGIGIKGGKVNVEFYLKDYTYIITDDITVESSTGSAVLTIQPGAVLKFNLDTRLNVFNGGKLIAQGGSTDDQKIKFVGQGEYQGSWYGLHFNGENLMPGNILDNCIISHGGKGYAGWSSSGNINCIYTNRVTVNNCYISDSKGWGVYVYNTTVSLSNNTFNNNVAGDTNQP